MLTHVVQRPFRDEGVKRMTGELVNALAWRWTARLVEQRYLAPIPPGLQPVRSVDGKWWADRQFLRQYGLQEERPAPAIEIATEAIEPDEPEWPRKKASGWWELSDGTNVRGKTAAFAAQAALEE